MRYLALACDYDGTLACDGQVSSDTTAALERLVASGRKLILVTGRELHDVFTVFSRCDLFEWIVAENGALLHQPATKKTKRLADPPPAEFIARLQAQDVPLSIGKSIVATRHPHENIVLEAIRELGLELQVIFNKGAVMVLPSGISKASGLTAALKEMSLSPHNVIAIGDAENDHALLALSECAVAVANALPKLKEKADIVTAGPNGVGSRELIDEIVGTDLIARAPRLTRHHLLLGTDERGNEIRIAPFGTHLLLTGPCRSSQRRAIAISFLARLHEQGYQFCVVDARGQYHEVEGAVRVGNDKHAPIIDEVLNLLKNPDENAIVNLNGVPTQDRPSFFRRLIAGLHKLRARTGHPHCLMMNEAEDVLPALREAPLATPPDFGATMYITAEPKMLARSALLNVNTVLLSSDTPEHLLHELGGILAEKPSITPTKLKPGEALLWLREGAVSPVRLKLALEKSRRASAKPSGHPATPQQADSLHNRS